MGQADYRGEKGQRKNKVLLVKPYGLKGTGLTKASKKGYVNVWIYYVFVLYYPLFLA